MAAGGPGSAGHGASPVSARTTSVSVDGDVHVALGRHVRLRGRDGGDDDIDVAEHGDHRGDAGHPAQRAVEAELADERQLLRPASSGTWPDGDEHADGDRQVEAGADLAQCPTARG